MPTMLFECTDCGAEGKITVRGDEFKKHDITVCPVCAADISQPTDDLDELDL